MAAATKTKTPKLKFTKMAAFPGFPTGFSTQLDPLGELQLFVTGYGVDVEVVHEGEHILIKSGFISMQTAKAWCQSLAEQPESVARLAAALAERDCAAKAAATR